jgi:hypothetical protein
MSILQQKVVDSWIQLRLEERKILTPEQLNKLADVARKRWLERNVPKE